MSGLKTLMITMAILLEPFSSARVIPSPQFLDAFASTFQKKSIQIALPDKNTNIHGLISLVKHFRHVIKVLITVQINDFEPHL